MLTEQIQRDISKNKLLKENNITLIYYTKYITESKQYEMYNNNLIFSTIDDLKKLLTKYETSN